MMLDDFYYLRQVKDASDKLAHKVDVNIIQRLVDAYLLSDSYEEKQEILNDLNSLLGVHASKLIFLEKPLLACPPPIVSQGRIKIGKVVHDGQELYDFKVEDHELNAHILITARSGHGKTTLLIQILKELLREKIPFIVFDFKKDFRHLVRHFSQLLVIGRRDLKINLFDPPPNVKFDSWKQIVVNVFSTLTGLWHGSASYLLEAIDKVYEQKHGIPKISEVYRIICEASENSRKMMDYASAVQVRLYSLISKLGPTIDNEKTTIDVEKLLKMPVVIELHDLGRDEQNLLVLWFFFWIYAYRRENNIRDELAHITIIDEAKRIFTSSEAYSQTTAEFSGIPPAELILDEIRTYSEGIILSDQEPSKLANAVKANSFVKICGFLGNGKDIMDMAEAMNLNEQEKEVLSHLERGEWLVKLAGRYTRPFLIKTEDFPIKRNLSDEELAELMRPKLAMLYKKSSHRYLKFLPEISSDSWKLLLNISANPFHGFVERARSLGFSVKRLEKAKSELLSKGLIREVRISLTGRRPKLFLTLTEKSIQLLKLKGISTKLWEYIGNVGFEHVLYQVLIRYFMRKLGFNAKLEAKVGSRRVDVLASNEQKKIAFEIELNPNVSLREKLSILDGLDALYIVTKKEYYSILKRKIGNAPSNVKVYSIDKLLERLRNLSREDLGINPFQGNKLKLMPSSRNKINSPRFWLKEGKRFGKNQR